jgi:methionyl-tRNA formyltransferase
MRIVFMGTPEFAIPSLKILLENKYDIVSVVTTPDKPSGRGQRLSTSPVKDFAVRRSLPLVQPEKLRDPGFVESLKQCSPDLFVVVAFRILPPEVFSIPVQGAFNLHASLLPKYRGAAPINWAIINGEKETGVTTFFLKESVDTGNIILQARVPITPDDTAGKIHDMLAEVGAEIVLHTVKLIETGKAVPKAQENSLATPAPKIFKDDCRIDWKKPAHQVHNFIRGLSPRPGAFTMMNDAQFKLYRSAYLPDVQNAVPGKIIIHEGKMIVAAGEGAIEILELQQEGKKILSAEEFLRGYRFSADAIFQ